MKRKRRSEQIEDSEVYDLILVDANGRSIRAHKALLIEKSDYFARILNESNIREIQLNENYLVELIRYLYNYEKEGYQSVRNHQIQPELEISYFDDDSNCTNPESSINNGDLVILMQLLALSRKYSFRKLYISLMNEINYKIRPSSVVTIYSCAVELGIEELQESTKLMILTWLPQVQNTEAFHNLSEESVIDIFSIESPDIDNECKLNALSAWWSRNKEVDMTNLWVKLITCRNN